MIELQRCWMEWTCDMKKKRWSEKHAWFQSLTGQLYKRTMRTVVNEGN